MMTGDYDYEFTQLMLIIPASPTSKVCTAVHTKIDDDCYCVFKLSLLMMIVIMYYDDDGNDWRR